MLIYVHVKMERSLFGTGERVDATPSRRGESTYAFLRKILGKPPLDDTTNFGPALQDSVSTGSQVPDVNAVHEIG